MLETLFRDRSSKAKKKHSELCEIIARKESDEKIDDFFSTQVLELLKMYELALESATEWEDYITMLRSAGVWTFFLASRNIRFEFNAPEFRYYVEEKFLDCDAKIIEMYDLTNPKQPTLRENFRRGLRIEGIAVRNSKDKTTIITVKRRYKKKYGKYIEKSKKYAIHDEFNLTNEGDILVAYEFRPMSKNKRFIFGEVKNRF